MLGNVMPRYLINDELVVESKHGMAAAIENAEIGGVWVRSIRALEEGEVPGLAETTESEPGEGVCLGGFLPADFESHDA